MGAPRPQAERETGPPSARGAGQRGLSPRDKQCAVAGAEEEARAYAGLGTCALKALAQCFRMTRLETRTKESNMRASRRVANP